MSSILRRTVSLGAERQKLSNQRLIEPHCSCFSVSHDRAPCSSFSFFLPLSLSSSRGLGLIKFSKMIINKYAETLITRLKIDASWRFLSQLDSFLSFFAISLRSRRLCNSSSSVFVVVCRMRFNTIKYHNSPQVIQLDLQFIIHTQTHSRSLILALSVSLALYLSLTADLQD